MPHTHNNGSAYPLKKQINANISAIAYGKPQTEQEVQTYNAKRVKVLQVTSLMTTSYNETS